MSNAHIEEWEKGQFEDLESLSTARPELPGVRHEIGDLEEESSGERELERLYAEGLDLDMEAWDPRLA